MTTIYVCTNATTDLHNSGDLNTPASRASFAAAWELAATRIGRVAGISVVADGDVDDPTMHRYNQRNRDAGIDRAVVNDLWQAAHDSVTTGSRRGRWIVASKATTDRYGKAIKAALASPTRDDE